jgi:GR25 family glycosyltransferase involved in LPS biosynthesis
MEYNKVWDYFKEIYCINLDRRQDRWENALKEFYSVGILDRVTRVSAVENQDGRIGLIKSFLKIFKDVKERGVENVLIFEDDVHFLQENNPIETLEKAISQIGSIEWSLFYLGANTHEKCNVFRPNLILLKNAFAAHAVGYNHKTYNQIIERFENTNEIKSVNDINDVFFCNEIQNKRTSFMVNPIIATQYPSFSDLEKRFVNYSFIEDRFKNNIK